MGTGGNGWAQVVVGWVASGCEWWQVVMSGGKQSWAVPDGHMWAHRQLQRWVGIRGGCREGQTWSERKRQGMVSLTLSVASPWSCWWLHGLL